MDVDVYFRRLSLSSPSTFESLFVINCLAVSKVLKRHGVSQARRVFLYVLVLFV